MCYLPHRVAIGASCDFNTLFSDRIPGEKRKSTEEEEQRLKKRRLYERARRLFVKNT